MCIFHQRCFVNVHMSASPIASSCVRLHAFFLLVVDQHLLLFEIFHHARETLGCYPRFLFTNIMFSLSYPFEPLFNVRTGSAHNLIHTAHMLPLTSSAAHFPPIPASSFVYQALPGSDSSAAIGNKRTRPVFLLYSYVSCAWSNSRMLFNARTSACQIIGNAHDPADMETFPTSCLASNFSLHLTNVVICVFFLIVRFCHRGCDQVHSKPCKTAPSFLKHMSRWNKTYR
jgi:hypothetical protein